MVGYQRAAWITWGLGSVPQGCSWGLCSAPGPLLVWLPRAPLMPPPMRVACGPGTARSCGSLRARSLLRTVLSRHGAAPSSQTPPRNAQQPRRDGPEEGLGENIKAGRLRDPLREPGLRPALRDGGSGTPRGEAAGPPEGRGEPGLPRRAPRGSGQVRAALREGGELRGAGGAERGGSSR